MLARSFLSAVDLGISNAERAALIEVLGRLERGELQHADKPCDGPVLSDGFNMAWAGGQYDCGTVACIGGWVAAVMGRKGESIPHYVNFIHGPLKHLYWPDYRNGRLQDITATQASFAVQSFLSTGKANWAEALA